MIGGLGSDTINVTGDVTEDIVTRELEGVSGAIDHLVIVRRRRPALRRPAGRRPRLQPRHAGPRPGDHRRRGRRGHVGARGRLGLRSVDIDWYSIRLAGDPRRRTERVHGVVRHGLGRPLAAGRGRRHVRRTRSRTRHSDSLDGRQGRHDLALHRPRRRATRAAQCTSRRTSSASSSSTACSSTSTTARSCFTFDGDACPATRRLERLTSSGSTCYAVDDPRSEGDRVVVVQHSTISDDPDFDAVAVRNVEVTLRDNDTPGVYVTQVTPGTDDEDQRTLVIEGGASTRRRHVAHDDVAIRLRLTRTSTPAVDRRAARPAAEGPGRRRTIRVKLVLDAASQQAIQLDIDRSTRRRRSSKRGTHLTTPTRSSGSRTTRSTSTTANWDVPVRVLVNARPTATARTRRPPSSRSSATTWDDRPRLVLNADGSGPRRRQERHRRRATVDRDPASATAVNPCQHYVFPNLRSGTGTTAVDGDRRRDRRRRHDRERHRHARRRSAATRPARIPATPTSTRSASRSGRRYSTTTTLDDADRRRRRDPHRRPRRRRRRSDGDGDRRRVLDDDYEVIGGFVPSQLFLGNITVSADGLTITRANGTDLGSFVDEGFERRPPDPRRRSAASTTTARSPRPPTLAHRADDRRSTIALPGGVCERRSARGRRRSASSSARGLLGGRRHASTHPAPTRAAGSSCAHGRPASWLADGFLEGQWVEVCISNGAGACTAARPVASRSQVIRGDNETKDDEARVPLTATTDRRCPRTTSRTTSSPTASRPRRR